MQITNPQNLSIPIPSPQNSMDWRFLLPILAESKVLIVGGGCDEFTQFFGQLGIESIAWDHDFLNPTRTPFPELHFEIIAIPHGFPDKGLSSSPQQHLEVYRTMWHFLKPGGTILIGFSNAQVIRRRINPDNYYSTPRLMRQLLQKAGYETVTLYGAIPNLFTPEYIFPLTRKTVGFTLKHRYRYKLPARLLRWFDHPFFTAGFSHLLPSYFATATVPTNH
jgi:hypothetical protein